MTSAQLVFCFSCLLWGIKAQSTGQKSSSSVRQEGRFISAIVGEKLTLKCFFDIDDVPRLYWYKQTLGHKPRLVSTLINFKTNGTFQNEFKNNPRFSLDTGDGINHLKITNLQISDSGTYYCARRASIIIEFAEGTTVSVKGSSLNIEASVHQIESQTIQLGGSVTLNCTVHTGTCDGGHSVYWFKDSEESPPGLFYTHGDRNDQCETKPDTKTHTCVYNLPMKSLNHSYTGIYYCAVASCGHILFGNGTKLDVKNEKDSHVLTLFLSGALAFTTILVVLLALIIYKMNKTYSLQSELQVRSSPPSRADAEGFRDADDLHYAALNVNLPNRSRRQRDNTKTECVYSSVKQ